MQVWKCSEAKRYVLWFVHQTVSASCLRNNHSHTLRRHLNNFLENDQSSSPTQGNGRWKQRRCCEKHHWCAPSSTMQSIPRPTAHAADESEAPVPKCLPIAQSTQATFLLSFLGSFLRDVCVYGVAVFLFLGSYFTRQQHSHERSPAINLAVHVIPVFIVAESGAFHRSHFSLLFKIK